MMNTIWLIVQILIGYNLVLPFIFFLFYLIFKTKKLHQEPSKNYDYAIIVTAYEQIDLLHYAVSSILKLNYSNYIVYVVADKCDVSNIKFEDPKVVLLRPENTLASNTRSHLYAIANFKREHEILTIIDSDNLTDPEYLNELNVFFDKGFDAVQGIRKAKNLDTTYACLDAARDIYYHFYDGEVLFNIGSSATLSGSGMAFRTNLYKACFENHDLTGAGFDKVLQAKILLKNNRIAFAEKAIVWDEKTTNANQLVNQRSRWINTWFKYSKFGFEIMFKGLRNLNLNQLIFGIVLIRPPLFIFILLSLGCLILNIFFNTIILGFWIVAFCIFILSFCVSLNYHDADPKIYRSLINIPKFIYFQLLSLIHSRKANERSVATKHHVK